MAEETNAANTTHPPENMAISQVLKELQFNWRFVLLDLALLVAVILLIFTHATVFVFHVIFLLLTVGAFYWSFRAFVVHAGVWVPVTTLALALTILEGKTHAGEIIEIPLLVTMLVLVFSIARRRARA